MLLSTHDSVKQQTWVDFCVLASYFSSIVLATDCTDLQRNATSVNFLPSIPEAAARPMSRKKPLSYCKA